MLLIIAAPDVRDHLSDREVSTVLFPPASIGSMVGELPRALDISEQWIPITIQEYSKSSLILSSAKRFSSSTYLYFGAICDILWYHRFWKAWFLADYLNLSQVPWYLVFDRGYLQKSSQVPTTTYWYLRRFDTNRYLRYFNFTIQQNSNNIQTT